MKPHLTTLFCLGVLCAVVVPVHGQTKDAKKATAPAEAPAASAPPFQASRIEKIRAVDSGIIEMIHAAPGDYVEADTLLVTLDSYRQKHILEVAKLRTADQSRIRECLADIDIRESTLETIRQRLRRRAATDQDLRQGEAQLDSAKAKLEAAQTNAKLAELDLKLAEINYENRFLKTPIAGIVATVEKEKGETVAAGAEMVTVADSAELKVCLPVSAAWAAKLAPGMVVPVRMADGMRELVRVARLLPGTGGNSIVELLVKNPEPTKIQDPGKIDFLFSEIPQTTPAPVEP